MMAKNISLRIATWNVWHALSPYGWGWLGPVFMPRLESAREARLRPMRQVDALLGLRDSEYDIFCLQEINPIERRGPFLSEALGMRQIAMRCNAGIKFGKIGLPLHLSDGLLTLTGKAFRKRKTIRMTLSGKAYQWDAPFGLPVFFQLGERRCALMVESVVRGRKIAIVNLHIHNGPEKSKSIARRREGELQRLARALKHRAKEVDLLVVCGDFNSDSDSKAVGPLLELGLEDAAILSKAKQKPTWVPEKNALTRISARVALERYPGCSGWEDQPHVFDRIYLRSKQPLKKLSLARVCDGPLLSDHYGVLAELTLG